MAMPRRFTSRVLSAQSTPPGPNRIKTDPPPKKVQDGVTMAAHSYACSIQQMMRDQSPTKADLRDDAIQQLARMQPRDAIEELLMSQMLMTHARLVFLSRFANKQTYPKWSDLFHKASDRAANTFRRQMESLAKYRKPRSQRRTNITTIRTAHINAKQIVTQPQPSAVQPVREPTPDWPEDDRPPKAETSADDQTNQTLGKEPGPDELPG